MTLCACGVPYRIAYFSQEYSPLYVVYGVVHLRCGIVHAWEAFVILDLSYSEDFGACFGACLVLY